MAKSGRVREPGLRENWARRGGHCEKKRGGEERCHSPNWVKINLSTWISDCGKEAGVSSMKTGKRKGERDD